MDSALPKPDHILAAAATRHFDRDAWTTYQGIYGSSSRFAYHGRRRPPTHLHNHRPGPDPGGRASARPEVASTVSPQFTGADPGSRASARLEVGSKFIPRVQFTVQQLRLFVSVHKHTVRLYGDAFARAFHSSSTGRLRLRCREIHFNYRTPTTFTGGDFHPTANHHAATASYACAQLSASAPTGNRPAPPPGPQHLCGPSV